MLHLAKRAKTSFQLTWQSAYGLEIAERHPGTHEVQSAQCLFCKFFGRQPLKVHPQKSKPTEKVHFYTPPWRADLVKKHLNEQHSERWAEYQVSTVTADYFKDVVARSHTLHNYLDKDKDTLTFDMSRETVEVIIGKLFFRDDDELAATDDQEDLHAADRAAKILKLKENAMALFKRQEDGSYKVEVSNPVRYELTIRTVACGASFRMTAAIMDQTRTILNQAKLTGINDTMVGQYVRVLVGAAIQNIGQVLRRDDVWAFALSFDGSTHRGTTFFDVRVRVVVDGVLHNLHLVAMPHFGRHTANNQVEMLRTLLGAISASWANKLIGVTTDGERTNMGHISGVQTQMVNLATHDVLQIWCVPHQLDLIVKGTTEAVDHGAWAKTVYMTSTYLRRQSNLIADMGVTCPKKTNRWAHLALVLQFLTDHQPRIAKFIEERGADHGSATPPHLSPAWWTVTYAIAPAIDLINTTFVQLQDRSLVLIQQRCLVENLANNLRELFSVQIIEEVAEFAAWDRSSYYRADDYSTMCILFGDMAGYIADQGSRAEEHFSLLGNPGKTAVMEEIASFAVRLITGVQSVQAERNHLNQASGVEAPPVMPYELVCMRGSTFNSTVLNPRRDHLAKFTSEDEVYGVEVDHRELIKAYKTEDSVRAIIDKQDHTTSFNDAWDSIAGARFRRLRRFCGGLATVFANSTSVESDFSILKWEKDDCRSDLLDLSLEGIFQSKQWPVLSKI